MLRVRYYRIQRVHLLVIRTRSFSVVLILSTFIITDINVYMSFL